MTTPAIPIESKSTGDNAVAATLLAWFSEQGRDLPWRHTRDPYKIWLSEVILQQTRVEQGRDYWLRFVERFPTVDTLAAAHIDEVLKLWQGLGYYSRARNLHAAAKQIVVLGHFPCTLNDIRSLRGVGQYTAAAIASLAFDIPEAVVDGNVYRVLSRHYGIDTPIDTTPGQREFRALATALLPRDRAAAFNQAIMDFGATVCTPQAPHCHECPLALSCVAMREDAQQRFPVKSRKVAVSERHFSYVYALWQGKVAFRRREGNDIWKGLWEPLLFEDCALPALEGELTLLKHNVKHVLTHRVIVADFYLLHCASRPSLPREYSWFTPEQVQSLAVPRLVERLLATLP